MNLNKYLIGLLAACALSPAYASPLLNEGFNDISTLGSSGWYLVNNSSPAGQTGWFQSNLLGAAAGPADSAIAANFLNASAGGAISNWLITPELAMANGNSLNFSLRLLGDSYLDTVQVYYSLAGASHNVGSTSNSTGDFVLLGSYSADTDTGWTSNVLTLSGLSGAGSGRFAFRYLVDNTDLAGDQIAIDSVSVSAVPEPSAAILLLIGLGVLGAGRKRLRGLVFASASATALVAQAAAPAGPDGLMSFPNARVVSAAELNLQVDQTSAATGLMAYKDPATGKLTGPTAEQAAEIAALSASSSARTGSRVALGGRSVPLTTNRGGRGFKTGDAGMNFAMAHKDADGKLVQSCLPGEDAARHLSHAPQTTAAQGEKQ